MNDMLRLQGIKQINNRQIRASLSIRIDKLTQVKGVNLMWSDIFPTKHRYLTTNTGILYLGDCLDVLQEIPDKSIQLIYIDPPFGCDRDKHFGMPKWKSTEEHYQFCDQLGLSIIRKIDKKGKRSNYGIAHYLYWIYPRLVQMHRVLAETGSIYVHLDYRMVHYVKLMMDEIFGRENFLNQIIWHYEGPQAPSDVKFATKHDVILRYAKTQQCKGYELYKLVKVPVKELGLKKDEYGNWFYTLPPGDYTDETLKRLEKEGRIYRTKSGKIRIKYFVEVDEKGYAWRPKKLPDVWNDIPSLGIVATEKLNFPTQKPEKLLERIILASSNEGDIVADFFCGSGTTLAVAEKLNRYWIGVDIYPKAIQITAQRLKKI